MEPISALNLYLSHFSIRLPSKSDNLKSIESVNQKVEIVFSNVLSQLNSNLSHLAVGHKEDKLLETIPVRKWHEYHSLESIRPDVRHTTM